MDLSAQKITVLDIDDDSTAAAAITATATKRRAGEETMPRQNFEINDRLRQLSDQYLQEQERVCLSYSIITVLTCAVAITVMVALSLIGAFLWRQKAFGSKY